MSPTEQKIEPPDDEAVLDEDFCPTCAGEGFSTYMECPEVWGEDCPSEEDHIITCPNCGGSGLSKDCHVW